MGKKQNEAMEDMNFNVTNGKNSETIKVSSDEGEVEMKITGDVDVDDAFRYMPQAYKRTSKMGKRKRK